jgi:hypothetical protein
MVDRFGGAQGDRYLAKNDKWHRTLGRRAS